jgi:AcrR family transcriptional regulator
MMRGQAKRRREPPDVRREQILNEAIRIIGERGYHGFSVQELAARCGLTNAGLLHHFSAKDQLLVAVIQHVERSQIEVISPLANAVREQPSPALILQLLETMVSQALAQPELLRLHAVLQAESLDRSHPAFHLFAARETAVLNLFTQLLEPYVDEPRSIARQMLAAIFGLTLQWLRAEQRFDMTAEWMHTVARLVPALRRETHRSKRKCEETSYG